MRAIWYENDIDLDRANMTREEEFSQLEGISYIQFDDISLEKAKRMLNGIDMHGVERVISTRNNVHFSVGDKIAFIDEKDLEGNYLTLKITNIEIKLDDKHKKTLNFMPNMKQILSDKVLVLK